MNTGYNQNISYRGEVYHIQTEDGGRKNPVITTILFKGGVIIASRKVSYSDIIRSDKLDQVVKELIKEQHTGMLRDLRAGAFHGE